MKLTKLSLAVASVMGAGLASEAMALDLYVDTKTQQIYAEPGRGRVKLGSFEKVEDSAAAKQEAQAQKAEIEQIKEDLALKNNELKALDEHMKAAEETKVTMSDKGLSVESADGNFKFKVGGRIQADADYSSGDGDLKIAPGYSGAGNHIEANNGTDIRRARLEFGADFYKDWGFKTVVDFAENEVALKDVFIDYKGIKDVVITAGQHKQFFSRELYESSNDLMFQERSLMNVLNDPVVDRAMGLSVKSMGKQWTADAGIFGNNIQPYNYTDWKYTQGNSVAPYDEGWGASTRVTYAPILEKDKLIHLGLAGNYRAPDANGDVSKSKGLSYKYTIDHMSNLPLLNQSVYDVENIKMLGVELSGMYGPFYLGGEYTNQWVERKNGGGQVNGQGWYVDAAWSITGESRQYKHGTFKYLKPKNNFSWKNGTWGAFEMATRYSGVTIDDSGSPSHKGVIPDTGAQNITLALNWYLNNNFRFMADYTRTFDIRNAYAVGPDGTSPNNIDAYMLRAQMKF